MHLPRACASAKQGVIWKVPHGLPCGTFHTEGGAGQLRVMSGLGRMENRRLARKLARARTRRLTNRLSDP